MVVGQNSPIGPPRVGESNKTNKMGTQTNTKSNPSYVHSAHTRVGPTLTPSLTLRGVLSDRVTVHVHRFPVEEGQGTPVSEVVTVGTRYTQIQSPSPPKEQLRDVLTKSVSRSNDVNLR